MQKANVRHNPHHSLAIDLEQHSQYAMGRRMLRPHIQDHGSILARFKYGSGREMSHSEA
jgi:hypothetical protein